MEFDRYTIVLLLTPDDPPQLSEEEADRLQDAHLSHLAELHERGVLLAAGPVGDPDRFGGRCDGDRVTRIDLGFDFGDPAGNA